jgi:hypothetical protein
MPNFKRDFGLDDDMGSLDDDMIEQRLVPAARDDLARSRQQLLATIVLMGINRIVVTDGKINAKIKFQFQAKENQQMTASAYDYVKTGNVYTSDGKYDQGNEGEWNQGSSSQGSWQGASSTGKDYAKGEYTSSVTPDVRVTSQVDTSSTGSIQASGQIMGEVSINFKSDVFPLEKLVDSGQLQQLQNAQAGGRPARQRAAGDAPAAGAPANAPQQAGGNPPPQQGTPPAPRST